jgi:hypothetical protein
MKNLGNVAEFKLANDEMKDIMGGSHCYIAGYMQNTISGETWIDINRTSGDGEIFETLCDCPDSEWGGWKSYWDIGTEIC